MPTSLLTIFSKALDKAVHSSLSQRLHTNNILVTEQCSAFMLTDSAFKPIDQKMHVGLIFCDLAKVSHCVTPEIL